MNVPLLANLPVQLYDAGAILIDTKVGFKLKHHEAHPDAPLSPVYYDFGAKSKTPEPGPLTPELIGEIGRILWLEAKARKLEFDAICGIPNDGIPLAEAFWQALYDDGGLVPNIILGKTEAADGSRKIEGVIEAGGAVGGDTVLLIDDVISRAYSKLEGVEVLEDARFKVTDVLVLIDREEGGLEGLADVGVRLHSLTTSRKMIRNLFEAKRISVEDRDTVLKYLAA